MKKVFKKVLATVLTCCLLPLPGADMLSYAAESDLYASEGILSSRYVSAEFNEHVFSYASASDAREDFTFFEKSITGKRLPSVYDTNLVLTEEELEHGVTLPLSGNGEKISDADEDLIEAQANTGEIIYIDTDNIDAISREFHDAMDHWEKKISPEYDRKTKRRLKKIIMGGSNLVKYLAERMTYGLNPIYVPGNYTMEEIHAALSEANWQNQMILEDDNLDYHRIRYVDQNGSTLFYKINIDYNISNPAQRKEYQLQMLDRAEQIIDMIGIYSGGREVGELYQINNYLIDHGEYNYDVADLEIPDTMQSKAYGILIEGNGICTSYARAFQLVARVAGFLCLVDGGEAAVDRDPITNAVITGPHAWNMVCIQRSDNGLRHWLMVDPTWNDDAVENGNKKVRNSYLMIPKNASQRNRVSDGSCFAMTGEYANIYQPSYNFDFDYMGAVGMSAANASDAIDMFCNYIEIGYLPKWFRCEWGINDYDADYILNQIYNRAHVSLDFSWTGYDAHVMEIDCLANYSTQDLRGTKKGLYEFEVVNGEWKPTRNIYASIPRGTKPEPEPEITEEERRQDEEEARRQEAERQRQEELRRQEEARRQNQSARGGSSGGGGGGGGSRSGGGGGSARSGGGGSSRSGSSTKKPDNTNTSAVWKQDARGWWYQKADGSYPRSAWVQIHGAWYLFDSSGYATKGWQQSGGKWYYMNASCAMQTGWVSDGGNWYFMDAGGAMIASSWIQSGGKWYYLGADGILLRNTRTPDGYMVKADGSL